MTTTAQSTGPPMGNGAGWVDRCWTSRFVGRSSEMELARHALIAAKGGDPRILIVGGEGGVGKTRFISELLESTKDSSTKVLRSACFDCADSPIPFGPIVETLRPLSRSLDPESQSDLLEPLREQLAAILPLIDLSKSEPVVAPAGSTASRAQLFETVLSLLEGLGTRTPLIFVIEDIHWADRSTRDFLGFLASALCDSRVAVILSYRTDELAPGHELLRYITQLQRNRGVLRLHLPRLDKSDLERHLYDLGSGSLDAELQEMIWQRSQGNPFFAEELFAAAEGGFTSGLPVGLADMLLGRLRAMSPSTQKAVRVVAAGGMTIDHRALPIVLPDLNGEALDAAFREAVERRILVNSIENGSLEFRHALLREAAYADMLPAERELVHDRYARWLGSLPANELSAPQRIAELAGHYASAGNAPKALATSLEAARLAENSRGYAETGIHLERALHLWNSVPPERKPDDFSHAGLLEWAARTRHLLGDEEGAVSAMRAALRESPASKETSLASAVQLGCYLQAAGESEEALGILGRAVEQTAELDDADLKAEVLCAFAQLLAGGARHRESVNFARSALEIAKSTGDRSREAQALTVLGSNLVVLGDTESGVEFLREALRLAEELGQPLEIATGYRDLATTLSGPLNRLSEALAVAMDGLAMVRKLGLERHWGVSLRSIAADTLFRMGRWDEAAALVTEALSRSPKGAAALELLLARAKLDVGRGHFAIARQDLDTVRMLTARATDLRFRIPMMTLEAGLALWEGRTAAAQEAVDTGLRWVQDTDDVWFVAPLVWHGLRAEVERASSARERGNEPELASALEKGEWLRKLSKASCRVGEQKGALRIVVDAYDRMCEGELRRLLGDYAVDTWQQAAHAWDRLGQPYPAAYARIHWASALLESKQAHDAAPVLRDAHSVAVRLGAIPLRECVERIASRAGIELEEHSLPRTLESVGPVSLPDAEQIAVDGNLTRRELQILKLVALGRSNREIAQECFISEKTVSVHVSNILNKLGVRSRVQAASRLHDMQTALSS